MPDFWTVFEDLSDNLHLLSTFKLKATHKRPVSRGGGSFQVHERKQWALTEPQNTSMQCLWGRDGEQPPSSALPRAEPAPQQFWQHPGLTETPTGLGPAWRRGAALGENHSTPDSGVSLATSTAV